MSETDSIKQLYDSIQVLEDLSFRDNSKELSEEERLRALNRPLLAWYRQNARTLPWRGSKDPYQIWISEIMLQQTRVEAVKPYFQRFLQELPDIESLAKVSEERLLKLWEGLGYYSRAKNLQKCAKILVEIYGGKMPGEFEKILKLPGIGSYTAGAIASIAFSIPVPAVDGNVLRVAARVLGDKTDISKPSFKKRVEGLLKRTMDQENPGDFNQAFIETGALVCVPNGEPKCPICPLASLCKARRDGLYREIPWKAPKKGRKKEALTVLILERDGQIALKKRPPSGLLASLYELPNEPGRVEEKDIPEAFGLKKEEILSVEALPAAKHIFSHVEWEMTGYRIRLKGTARGTSDMLFTEKKNLEGKYPLPNAFLAYRKLIM